MEEKSKREIMILKKNLRNVDVKILPQFFKRSRQNGLVFFRIDLQPTAGYIGKSVKSLMKKYLISEEEALKFAIKWLEDKESYVQKRLEEFRGRLERINAVCVVCGKKLEERQMRYCSKKCYYVAFYERNKGRGK